MVATKRTKVVTKRYNLRAAAAKGKGKGAVKPSPQKRTTPTPKITEEEGHYEGREFGDAGARAETPPRGHGHRGHSKKKRQRQ